MKTVLLNGYTFQYADNMVYFNDQRYHNVLFVKTIPLDDKAPTAYDGAQLIIKFYPNQVKFTPLWNIQIEQINDKEYLLTPKVE